MRDKRTVFVSLFVGLVVTLCLFSGGSRAWSQADSYSKINPKGKKAHGRAISDKTVLFEVTLGSDKVTKLLIPEGEMAKIGDLSEKYAFALVPVIKDMSKKSVRFTVFRLTQDEEGNEYIRELEGLDTKPEALISSNTEPSFKLRLVSIQEPRSDLGSTNSDERAALNCKASKSEPDPDCCLECPDGTWACAMCVWKYCGCCCDPPRDCLLP